MWAIFNNFENIAIKIIDKFDDNCLPNHINNYGNTALICACVSKLKNVAEKLLDKFKDNCLLEQKNKYDKTALYYAKINKLISVVNKINDLKKNNIKINKAYNYDDENCIICLGVLNDKCIMLINCGHSCYCRDCSLTITKCAICNENINNRFEIPYVKV
jgi:ankyrin repeat protein